MTIVKSKWKKLNKQHFIESLLNYVPSGLQALNYYVLRASNYCVPTYLCVYIYFSCLRASVP